MIVNSLKLLFGTMISDYRTLKSIISDGTYEERFLGLGVDEVPVLDINDINSRGQSAEDTDCRDSSSRETHDVGGIYIYITGCRVCERMLRSGISWSGRRAFGFFLLVDS